MAKNFVINKKFEINHNSPSIEGHTWLRQPDANSCGYHLVHNAHPYIQIPNYEGSPEGVFETMNRLRRQKNKEPLSQNENLLSFDLSRYFHDKGFHVNTITSLSIGPITIGHVLAQKEFELIYSSSNIHYTGIVKNQGNLIYLDSLTRGPSVISENEAYDKMIAGLGQDHRGKTNIVGIVTRLHKKFDITKSI
ncbi:MAG: hypothetical protein ABH828_00915 [archaeon]